jgi:2-methylisocitrate lyase-like PEP mutase family enzyme
VIGAVPGKGFSLPALAEAGVRRVSLAASLYRAAMTGLLDAAREAKQTGEFTYVDRIVTGPELSARLKD